MGPGEYEISKGLKMFFLGLSAAVHPSTAARAIRYKSGTVSPDTIFTGLFTAIPQPLSDGIWLYC